MIQATSFGFDSGNGLLRAEERRDVVHRSGVEDDFVVSCFHDFFLDSSCRRVKRRQLLEIEVEDLPRVLFLFAHSTWFENVNPEAFQGNLNFNNLRTYFNFWFILVHPTPPYPNPPQTHLQLVPSNMADEPLLVEEPGVPTKLDKQRAEFKGLNLEAATQVCFEKPGVGWVLLYQS